MLPYRKCVVIVLRKKDKLFLGERYDILNAWQFPQGGIEENEDNITAAKRELYEETGIISIKFLKQTSKLYRYDFPKDIQEKALNKYGVLKYRGQEQSFVMFDFLGDDSEVNLQSVTVEFRNWIWSTPFEAVANIVDFKYESYKEALTELELLH